MRYLLDTNIVSDLVRNPQGQTAKRIRKLGESQVCTSIIVAAELRYGAVKKGSQRLTDQLEAVLGALEVLPFEPPQTLNMAACAHNWKLLARPLAAMTC
jgi:tRNA(fMet)-specific endonuclease VapC